MAYEEVTDLGTDNVIALGGVNKQTGKSNPTSIEGYFLGSREVPSAMSKTGFAKIHVFKTASGNTGVWGKTDLDLKLASVTPGTMTLAKFDRMQPQKGKQSMYKYKVLVDSENTIEVAGATAAETSDTSADYNDTTTEDTVDEDEAQAAALANAERRAAAARVQALVGKRK